MKKNVLTLFAVFLLLSNSAKAANFTLNVSEDAKYIYRTEIISNYPDLVASNYAVHPPVVTLLKFNIVNNKELFYALNNSVISSVTLNIFRFRTKNDPISKVYYLNNDNWYEGSFPSHHQADFPVYDNDSYVGSLPLVPEGTSSQQGWISAQLDKTLFNAETDGVFSLLIANSNYSYYQTGQDSIDQFLNHESFNGNFPSSLTINTAPVPEPSSMILGLMGLGSMLGFRRKSIMNLGIRTEVNAGK